MKWWGGAITAITKNELIDYSSEIAPNLKPQASSTTTLSKPTKRKTATQKKNQKHNKYIKQTMSA